MLRSCLRCTALYSVGAEACPQCGAPDSGNVDQGEEATAAEAAEFVELSPSQQVRLWARENGIDVADGGPIPKAVQEQYDAAHAEPDELSDVEPGEVDS